MTRAERRLLDHLTEAVPRGIRAAGVTENSCILASRLGIEALRAKGVRARALAVKLHVMTEAYAQMLDVPNPDLDEWRAKGAWCVAIGAGGDGSGYDGHLVVIVGERYLLDLTAQQVRRLQKGIEAEAFWTEARDLARGEGWAGRNENGDVWLYEPTGDKSYVAAPAWSGYRISVRGEQVISERTRLRADVPVAPEIRVALPTAG